MANTLPVVNIPDYAFKNKDGVLFENTTEAWGLNESSFSNGGAYADLDNDGDLDFVVNNINDQAFIYENTLNSDIDKKESIILAINIGRAGLNKNAWVHPSIFTLVKTNCIMNIIPVVVIYQR